MNEYYVLAFIITPTIVVALGWGAALLHEWDMRRRQAAEPASSRAFANDRPGKMRRGAALSRSLRRQRQRMPE
jgi:hypothetical protein